jgi:hypothetical protein
MRELARRVAVTGENGRPVAELVIVDHLSRGFVAGGARNG